jgi:hypothetical protein
MYSEDPTDFEYKKFTKTNTYYFLEVNKNKRPISKEVFNKILEKWNKK